MKNKDRNFLDAFNIPSFNLARYILEGNQNPEQASRIAIKYKEHQITFQKLYELVNHSACYLMSIGVKKGDHVMLIIGDTPAFPVLFLSCVLIGAIATPINPGLNIETVKYMVNHLNIKFIYCDKQMHHKFESLRNEPCVSCLEFIGDYTDPTEKLHVNNDNTLINFPQTAGEEFAYCLFSSGTTGNPKAIPHKHFDPLYCAISYGKTVLEMNADDTVFSVAKLSFGYALVGVMLFSLVFGATMILDPHPPEAKNIIENIKKYKPTIFLGQPRMISDILKAEVEINNFNSLRLVVTAGEVLSPILFDMWYEKYKTKILDGFGSTEVGHIFISNMHEKISKGSLGVLLPGYEAKIIDDAGNIAPPQTPGRLCIKGLSLFKKYINDEIKTTSSLVDGWFISNDLFQEIDGFYYFIGRADDMIKTGCGEWISPIEIENVIRKNEKVLDCAVVGYRDERNIIKVKGLIASSIGPNKQLAEEITVLIKNTWPDLTFKHLHRIDFVSSLPRSEAGKLLRNKLHSHTLADFSYDC